MISAEPSLPLADYKNIVVISDTHFGCQKALCPPHPIRLDNGGTYSPSRIQRKLWAQWCEFWDERVPQATREEPYVIVHNGDVCDGRHHGSISQITQNLHDQANIAREVLAPRIEGHPYFQIRGTEAHSGPSAENEEALAESLGAIPNDEGQYARYDLWKRIGRRLVHFTHHIGITGSQAYASTAVHKELIESFVEAARCRLQAPSVIVRSHRHHYIETRISTELGDAIACVTPAWQLDTGFVWKTVAGRSVLPQTGGIVVREAHGELFTRSITWNLARSRAI